MSIIDQAIEHYQTQEKLIILVPEWGTKDNPLEIHVFPITMAEVNMIQRIARKNASNIEHAANIIIVKARDKDGNRLFKLEDREALMQKVDYRVVSRIAENIEARFFGSVETHKGN
jgi:hypothetical protein